MNIELEKRAIIEEIKADVLDEHKTILDSRLNSFERGQSKLIDLDDAKKRLKDKR